MHVFSNSGDGVTATTDVNGAWSALGPSGEGYVYGEAKFGYGQTETAASPAPPERKTWAR